MAGAARRERPTSDQPEINRTDRSTGAVDGTRVDKVPYRAGPACRLAGRTSLDAKPGLVILMIYRDRPSIRLTADERHQFDELAARLRYELDGASFGPPTPGRRSGRLLRRWRGSRWRRAVRFLLVPAGARAIGPSALALGLLALASQRLGWITVASPALVVLAASVAGFGAALTAADLVRGRRRRNGRPTANFLRTGRRHRWARSRRIDERR